MTTNSQIILNGILDHHRKDADPEADPSSFFEFFTAQQILKDFDLSYDEIDAGLVGGSDDGGIDSFYILVNGDLVREDSEYEHLKKDVVIDLVIIQSKRQPSFKETPVERFITASNDLFDLSHTASLSDVYNEHLAEAIYRFHSLYRGLSPSFPQLNISFYYASMGTTPSKNIKRKASMLRELVKEQFPHSNYNFTFIGASELLELANRQPNTTFTLPLAETPIASENQVGYVCLVRLQDYFDLISDGSGMLQRHLFEANVRDYQGHTQVNDEIQESPSRSWI
ncbi:MAG: hypothetical protein F4W93_06250 [Dehalococcoidia bacterium]|nr:hypothetical protein [Dehalococcoidia bacterium]